MGTAVEREAGIWCYNGVLTGIALGGVVFAPANLKR
jgi:urea transporter